MSVEQVATFQAEFETASSWLSSTPAAAALPNEIKLELYGLFKYIGSEEGPTSSRPSIFYPAARAKHDAWVMQVTKYSSISPDQARNLSDAKRRYVEIAEQVGWDGRVEEEVIDLERLDEPDLLMANDGKQGNGEGKEKEKEKNQGMNWRSVSVMARPEDIDETGQAEEDEGETSPIHEAVTADDLDKVRKLINQQPDLVNAIDEFGYTPLHLAADRGYPEMTKLLLELGADKTAKDEDDQTALELAQISSRNDIIAILQ